MAVSSSFQTRTTCSKRLGNLAKTAFFCVGCLTHSLLQYRDLAVIAAALLPVHFVDFILATIDVQLLNFTHILRSNVKIIVLG